MLIIVWFLFQVENEADCSFDYLAIYDGASSDSTLIGKFCGEIRPKEISSTGPYLYLKFRSDGSVSKEGFKISYESSSGINTFCQDLF